MLVYEFTKKGNTSETIHCDDRPKFSITTALVELGMFQNTKLVEVIGRSSGSSSGKGLAVDENGRACVTQMTS